MSTKLLIADPNAGFAMMVKQVLEDTGEYRVTVVNAGGEAIQAAAAGEFDLAVVDMELEDMPAAEVIHGIRAAKPRLAVMAIPVDNDETLPELATLDLQGTLSKPFFIPDLPAMIEAALARPIGGVAPAPRTKPLPQIVAPGSKAPAPARPGLKDRPVMKSSPRASDKPPPPWLLDVNKSAQYLTRLSLETAAEAALITRGNRLWAYAGHFASQQAEELARVVAGSWAKDGGIGSLAKFVRLSDNKLYFMLYSMPVAADFVLSLVFQAETPIGMIRKQARKLAETLVQTPPAETPPPAPPAEPTPSPSAERYAPPPEMEIASAPPAPYAQVEPAPPVPELDYLLVGTGEPLQPIPASGEAADDDDPALFAPPPAAGLGDWQKEILDCLPDLGTTIVEDTPGEPVPSPEPAASPVGTIVGFEHTPGALYQLTYTFVMLPKLPRYRMAGELSVKLDEYLRHYAVVFHWRIDRLTIHPNYAVVVLTCPPTTAPERVMRTLRRMTSQRIAADFPRAMPDDPTGDFWTRPYLLFNADHDPDPAQIADFISQVRKQQGLIG